MFEIQRYWQFPGGHASASWQPAPTVTKAVALDGSDSASQSFCQVVPHSALKILCSIPGAPEERVERETGISKSKTQACRQQKWASHLALREASIAKHLQKRGTHPSPRGLQALLCSIHTGSQAVQQGDGSYVHLPLTRRDLALARRDGASTAHKRCSSLMGATLQGLESHRTTIPVLWITSAQHGAVPKETRPGKRLISCAPS